MGRGYPRDWNRRRRRVYRRDNYTCQRCGRRNVELHAHRVVPKSRSESHKLSNLRTLCKSCHAKAHGKKRRSTRGFWEEAAIQARKDARAARREARETFGRCPNCAEKKEIAIRGRVFTCRACKTKLKKGMWPSKNWKMKKGDRTLRGHSLLLLEWKQVAAEKRDWKAKAEREAERRRATEVPTPPTVLESLGSSMHTLGRAYARLNAGRTPLPEATTEHLLEVLEWHAERTRVPLMPERAMKRLKERGREPLSETDRRTIIRATEAWNDAHAVE